MKKLLSSVAVAAAIAFMAIGGSVDAWAERRVALVVGNSGYKSVPTLPNPRNDAEDVSAVLKTLGFEVKTTVDASKRDMDLALADFARRATDADAALFFYAGHAMQFQGRNYLMPTDAELEDEISVRYQMVGLQDVTAALDRATGVKIMILDACRNNPLSDRLQKTIAGLSRSVATTRGLARIDKAQGMVVAYATQADEVASDGDGRSRNSPFTAALLKRLQEPGLEIQIMFTRVRADVYTQTGGRQRPETTNSLLSEYYLNQNDRVVFERMNKDDRAALRDFIAKYPSSPLVNNALHQLDVLERIAREREEERRKAEEEAKRKAAEAAEAKRRADEAAEAKRRADEAAETKRRADEAEAKRKTAEAAEAKRRADEAAEAKRRADEAADAKRKADEAAEAKRKADEVAEARRKADEAAEARRRADEVAEARRKADEAAEARRRADEAAEARRKADEAAEARRKADEVAEARRKADEAAEAKRKADEVAEAKRKADERLADLGQKPDIPAARVPPPVTTPPGPVTEPSVAKANRTEQIRQAQAELKRLGCFDGRPDGQLNDATRSAVKSLWKHTGKPVVEINITDEFVNELKQQRKEICLPESRPAPPVASRPPSHGKEAPAARRPAVAERPAGPAPKAEPSRPPPQLSSGHNTGVGF